MHDEMDETFEERRSGSLIDLARSSYHVPPPTPRDAMWDNIQQAASVRPIRRSVTPAWWGAMAAGIVLAAGIAIGRWSAGMHDGEHVKVVARVATATAPESVPAAYQATVQRHLAQSEVLLTEYRARAREGKTADVALWARDLLGTTRLLMDSPAANDARMKVMLEDLELILAQIVQASASPDKNTDYVERALEERALLEKLRSAVPAGATWSGS